MPAKLKQKNNVHFRCVSDLYCDELHPKTVYFGLTHRKVYRVYGDSTQNGKTLMTSVFKLNGTECPQFLFKKNT